MLSNLPQYPAQPPPTPPAETPLPGQPTAVPRRGTAGWIVAYLFATLVTWLGAWTIFSIGLPGGMAALWAVFRAGGGASYMCLLANTLTAAALAPLGIVFITGRRVPRWLLFGVALTPFWAGMAGAFLGHRSTLGVLSGESITRPLIARLFAVATAGEQAPIVFGCGMTAMALSLVGLAALGRLVSIDRDSVDPARDRPVRHVVGMAGVVSVIVLFAGGALRAALGEFHGAFTLLMFGLAIPASMLAASRAPLAPLLDRDPQSKGDVASTLLLLAMAIAAAALFLGFGGGALAIADGLDAFGENGEDPRQRMQILAEAVSARGRCFTLGLIDALLLGGALLVPLLRSERARDALRSGPALVPGALALVLPLGVAIAYEHSTAKDRAALVPPKVFEAVAGLSPPVSRIFWGDPAGKPIFFVTKEGRLLIDASDGREPPTDANEAALQKSLEALHTNAALVVDASTTYATLLRALKPLLEPRGQSGREVRNFWLVLAPSEPTRVPPGLSPDWAWIPGDGHTAIAMGIDRGTHPGFLVVVQGSSTRASYAGKVKLVPLSATAEDERRRQDVFLSMLPQGEKLQQLVVMPGDQDTVATLARIAGSAHAISPGTEFALVLSPSRESIDQMMLR